MHAIRVSERSRVRRSTPAGHSRRGAIVVLAAFLMIVMVALVAFAIDLGYMANVRTELQRSADSAALAAAGGLVMGTANAQSEAEKYVALNPAGGNVLSGSNAIQVEFGSWNDTSRLFSPGAAPPSAVRGADRGWSGRVARFSPGAAPPSAVRVTLTNPAQPLFFAKALGQSSFTPTSQAVAVYQPRDIALVLDYSGSMCFDSQFRSLGLLGQAEIEANLVQIYQQLGSPIYGSLQFNPVRYGNSGTRNSVVKKQFRLTNVAYPYPGGSWDEYIDYVQADRYVLAAGYRNAYGYMTWLNYVQAKRGSNSNTPGLWQVSEQPVTALKDAVDVFLSYLTAHSTDDRVCLSIYTYSDNTAILEQGLTKTYSTISTICRQRQAGHYIGGTNISGGMTKGRLELQNNGRSGALKLMVCMTDGMVNLPTGNSTVDKNLVLKEANLCAAKKIVVVTISVGALADTALMQQVADITNGAAFVVPGGQPISEVEEQLEEIFAIVAADRPLKLVQ